LKWLDVRLVAEQLQTVT